MLKVRESQIEDFNGSLQEKTIIQTSAFTTGLYLIKLENGNSVEFKKVVKN